MNSKVVSLENQLGVLLPEKQQRGTDLVELGGASLVFSQSVKVCCP